MDTESNSCFTLWTFIYEIKEGIYLSNTNQEAALTQRAEDPHEGFGEILQQDDVETHKTKNQSCQELHNPHVLGFLKQRSQHQGKEHLREGEKQRGRYCKNNKILKY